MEQLFAGQDVILIVTSKIPLANGKSLWRTCKIIGNPVKNGNQLEINSHILKRYKNTGCHSDSQQFTDFVNTTQQMTGTY